MRLGGPCLILLLLAFLSAGRAQQAASQPDGPEPPAPAPRPPAAAASQPATLDPTRPGERLRAFLNPDGNSPGRAAKEAARLPRFVKRGFIEADGGEKPEALIEAEGPGPEPRLGGSIQSIREGSTLTASPGQGSSLSLTFRVTKLSRDEIEMECVAPDGPLKGRTVVIH